MNELPIEVINQAIRESVGETKEDPCFIIALVIKSFLENKGYKIQLNTGTVKTSDTYKYHVWCSVITNKEVIIDPYYTNHEKVRDQHEEDTLKKEKARKDMIEGVRRCSLGMKMDKFLSVKKIRLYNQINDAFMGIVDTKRKIITYPDTNQNMDQMFITKSASYIKNVFDHATKGILVHPLMEAMVMTSYFKFKEINASVVRGYLYHHKKNYYKEHVWCQLNENNKHFNLSGSHELMCTHMKPKNAKLIPPTSQWEETLGRTLDLYFGGEPIDEFFDEEQMIINKSIEDSMLIQVSLRCKGLFTKGHPRFTEVSSNDTTITMSFINDVLNVEERVNIQR